MSLPPGFLDELRTRLSLTDVVGRKVTWDTRKSNQGKGDMWAPCPFHQEKTASFHVDDRKGFYYCFGCHAKGDAITFVRETENVDFMEAVKILAGEAGMQVPAADPRAQQKADRRTQLIEVMEMAVQFFRLQLKSAAGSSARGYLHGRGLDEAAWDRWGLGFAPDGWQNLWDHLKNKGVAEDLILACGLAKPSNKGKAPYDTFRNRIMFPIRDARGRAIAFGGRAMDPNDNAKYLNSPETELFDKGRNLYNFKPAREAAGKGQPLIVAEGYMDVIALSEAGFGATVAPLGTAVTEDQLHLLWRMSSEPIMALDGDTAGIRAAHRVVDLSLPLLEAGKSLRFVILPEGQDPDDLIRAGGSSAMQQVIDGAQPMVNLLWDREIEGKSFDSPERKAALDKALRDKIKLIRDPSIRGHYGQAIKDLRWDLFRPAKKPFTPSGNRGKWQPPSQNAMPTTKASALAAGTASVQDNLREAVILATLIVHPQLLYQFETQVSRMECANPDHANIRASLMVHAAMGAGVYDAIAEDVGFDALETLFTHNHVAIAPAVRHKEDTETAELTLGEELAKLKARRGHAREIDDALEDLYGVADESLTYRLQQAAEAMNSAGKVDQDDSANYIKGNNGALMNKEEREAFDDLLKAIGQTKSAPE